MRQDQPLLTGATAGVDEGVCGGPDLLRPSRENARPEAAPRRREARAGRRRPALAPRPAATRVGPTVLGTAAGRAVETNRADAMISDPFAAAFVRAADLAHPMPTTPEQLRALAPPASLLPGWRYLGVRTRFFDDFLSQAWSAGLTQAVILGAGLDTRAFRLDWPPGSVVFEVDRQPVLEFKRAVLDEHGAVATCEHHLVAADLRDDWPGALRAAGLCPRIPTVWLVEGLQTDPPPDTEDPLFGAVEALSAPGSRIAVVDAARTRRTMAEADCLWAAQRWGLDLGTLGAAGDRRAAVALRARGWTVLEEPVAAAAERFGHHPDPGAAEGGRFVTAERIATLDEAAPGHQAVWKLAASLYRSAVGWSGTPF
jgi:methyltransferase (TIGR00027 family)